MTRETKGSKGQGYTLNAKEANLKYERDMVILWGFFIFHIYLIEDFFFVKNVMYNIAGYT